MGNPDLERDLLASEQICTKVRNDLVYAQNLYAALCNNEFQKRSIWAMLKGQTWSCTWRYAGDIIAGIRGEGDYMDWYCSGMWIWVEGDGPEPSETEKQYVPEGMITESIKSDFVQIGWNQVDK